MTLDKDFRSETMYFAVLLCLLGVLNINFASGFLADSFNQQCMTPFTISPVAISYDLDANIFLYPLILDHPSLVNILEIDRTRCPVQNRQLFKDLSISYVEASDGLQQSLDYSKSITISGSTQAVLNFGFDRLLYTQNITLGHSTIMPCERVALIGCETKELCSVGYCQNGGTCIESNTCTCAAGYFGDRCELPIAQLDWKDFAFLSKNASGMYTPDAVFDIIGDVTFLLGHPTPQQIDHRRHDHHHHEHPEAGAHFHGPHGELYHQHDDCHDHHVDMYMRSEEYAIPYTDIGPGHHGRRSHDHCSDVFDHDSHHGYSHDVTAQFGPDHDDHHNFYLYSTHGDQHNNYGCSLGYHDGKLDMHVQGPHDHHHCEAHFHHEPHHDHHITTSYSSQYGCQIYVDGKLSGSSSKPQPVAPPSATSQPLCMGTCGAPSNGLANVLLSNVSVPLMSIPGLATNGLLSLLGPTIARLLQNQPLTTIKPTPPTTLPTTTPKPHIIVTATSRQHIAGTTPQHAGNLCYSCDQKPGGVLCSNLVTCAVGEVCAVFNDTHGFTKKCLDKQACDLGAKVTTSKCWHCCDTDLCNDKCPVQCDDTQQCGVLKSTGYDVCSDSNLATTECKKTCNHCP